MISMGRKTAAPARRMGEAGAAEEELVS